MLSHFNNYGLEIVIVVVMNKQGFRFKNWVLLLVL
jgi:hypothetical protein